MKYLLVTILFLTACASPQQKQCERKGGKFHDRLCWNKPLPKGFRHCKPVKVYLPDGIITDGAWCK